MWDKFMDRFLEMGTELGFRLIMALLVIGIGLRVVSWVVKRMTSSRGYQRLEGGIQSFFRSFLKIGLNILVFLSAAYILGIPMTSFVTVLASGGVAIGLALQGALSNFAGGLMILLFKPFQIGDFVEAGGYSGTVQGITVFYTILITPDNKRVTLPNGGLTNAAIVDYSCEATRRVDLTFAVGYGCEIDPVKELLLSEAASQGQVLSEPEPFARMTAQKDYALEFTLRVWCAAEDYWEVLYDLNEKVKRAFDREGIEIPFPQLDVHVREKK
ncbi:MAG: mechanosensitive ion channel [Lachnospiraceae bacterium]|nr:mechanosensitive ion channel [Lachnospiraceae bacterium]